MLKTCSWLIALAGLVGLAGTTHAGAPGVTPLFLPQLFGHESAPAATGSQLPQSDAPFVDALGYPICPFTPFTAQVQPTCPRDHACPSKYAVAVPFEQDNCLTEVLDTGSALLAFYGPVVRAVVHQLKPFPPYDLAVAGILESLSYSHVVQRAAASPGAVVGGVTDAAVPPPPACWVEGCAPTCEVLPYPKVVSGPNGCRPSSGCVIGCGGSFATGAAPCVPCPPCNLGSTCPMPSDCDVVDACDNVPCCPMVVMSSACSKATKASKACKCCEDCKDCKDCTCSKVVTVSTRNGPVYVQRIMVENMRPWAPVALPPLPPPPCMAPFTMASIPPPPHMMPFGPPMVAHPPMHEMPSCLVEELKELVRQREMICAAIAQVEQELAWATHQHHRHHMVHTPVSVACNAQKVHLVTEHFEAHCDSLHCVGGDAHRLMLEGNVRLSCKKAGQSVRIEAPCVVVNMKDGTFAVESQSVLVSQPCVPPAVKVMHPMPPVMFWTPYPPGSMGSDFGQARPPVRWQSVILPPTAPWEVLHMPTPDAPAPSDTDNR